MKRKFSIAHLSALKVPPQDMVYMAAAAGFDFVSIRPVLLGTPGEPNYAVDLNPEMYKEFDVAMAETGMKLSDIELFRLTDEVDMDKWKPAFEFAQKHDCHHLITSCWTQKTEYAKETLAKLCEMTKPYGCLLYTSRERRDPLRRQGDFARRRRIWGRDGAFTPLRPSGYPAADGGAGDASFGDLPGDAVIV